MTSVIPATQRSQRPATPSRSADASARGRSACRPPVQVPSSCSTTWWPSTPERCGEAYGHGCAIAAPPAVALLGQRRQQFGR